MAALREAVANFRRGARARNNIELQLLADDRAAAWIGHPSHRSQYPALAGITATAVLLAASPFFDSYSPILLLGVGIVMLLVAPLVIIMAWNELEYAAFPEGIWVRRHSGSRGLQEIAWDEVDECHAHKPLFTRRWNLVTLTLVLKGASAKRARVRMQGLTEAEADAILELATAHETQATR